MSLQGKTANNGEWAEIYVFLKLLGEGKLYAADRHLEKKSSSYVDVLRVIREEIAGELSEYVREGDESIIEIYVSGELVGKVPASDFLENARDFFEYLNSGEGKKNAESGGAFPATEKLCDFSQMIHVSKAKAPSLSSGKFGGKTDIVLKMHDGRNAMVSTMGFSIKAQFASAPTLYNAGGSTQFLYEIEGMDDAGMEAFNGLRKTVKRNRWLAATQMYREMEWNAKYIGTANPVTEGNFFLIRESMPELMAWIYKRALLEDYPNSLSFVSLATQLADENPLGYPSKIVYEKAIKDFLFASFAGMTGARAWDGTEQVNGGYIVVLPNGEVLCYHANDREAFREYLFTQTHIDYVDQKPKKYNWGTVRKEGDGRFVIPLNGSARFYGRYKEVEGR